MPAVPFKINAGRRHHIPKQRYRVANWTEYDTALRQHGSFTVWLTKRSPCRSKSSNLVRTGRLRLLLVQHLVR